jgi:hypothetical protein
VSPPRLARALAPVAALALALLACGDDGEAGSDGTTTTTTEAADTTSSTSTTTTAAAEDDGEATTTTGADHGDEEEGLAELEALVPQLLIAAPELGPDAEDIGFRPQEDVDCSVDADHTPDVLAGTGLQVGTQVVEEVLRVYPSPEEAEAAFEAWLAFPPECTFGWGVAMGEPVDGGEPVGADRSVVYTAERGGGSSTTVVVALVSDTLVTTAVTGTPGLDPVEVGAFAVGKVQAALES